MHSQHAGSVHGQGVEVTIYVAEIWLLGPASLAGGENFVAFSAFAIALKCEELPVPRELVTARS